MSTEIMSNEIKALVEDFRRVLYDRAGGGPSDSNYDPELLDSGEKILGLISGVGAVLVYQSHGKKGVCGSTICADGSGTFCDIILGPPEVAHMKANATLNSLQRSGFFISFAAIVRADDEGFSGHHLRMVKGGTNAAV